jgi:hypothetical protein
MSIHAVEYGQCTKEGKYWPNKDSFNLIFRTSVLNFKNDDKMWYSLGHTHIFIAFDKIIVFEWIIKIIDNVQTINERINKMSFPIICTTMVRFYQIQKLW